MSEILKRRYAASFVFEVTVTDNAITESGNDPEIQHYDLALLHQFLKTDQSKVKRLIGENIALQMGTWTIDDIEKNINGIVIEDGDEDKEDIFGSAIDALLPIEHQWWQEILDDPQSSISECTENIVDCFDVNLVSSQLQEAINVKTIEALPAIEFDEVDIEDDDFVPIIRLDEEEAVLTSYVSIDEVFGKGFSAFLEKHRNEEKQREATTTMNSDEMKSIIEILKNTRKSRFPSDHAINTGEMIPQNFVEDDVYTGQFRKLYEGHSINGECHYLTYARFTVTRGNDVVRYITDLNVKGIVDPVGSLTQHINLGGDEIEDLFLAYLEWSLMEQGVDDAAP